MNSDVFHQAAESSLLKVTAQLGHSENLILLGKKLVSELKINDSVDTLGRWMAHHIAELIHDAEGASEANRPAKQGQLRDAILAVWAHRFELTTGKRPFFDFEPILRALESLDPERDSFRYYSAYRAPVNENEESEETMRWLELAKRLDESSKIFIAYCLTSAADSALDKSKEWVELAKKAGVDDGFEFLAIQFIGSQRGLMSDHDLNENQCHILTDRRKKLEGFILLATNLLNDLKERQSDLVSVDD